MSISFNEALENEILSEDVINIIPKKCKCGRDIILSDSLKTARCSDNKCIYNTFNRLEQFNNRLNIGISTFDMELIAKKLKLSTPYQILMIDEAYESGIIVNGDIHNIESIVQNIRKIKQSEYFVYEIIEIVGIEKITNVAKSIFQGFNSVDEAFDEIERGQVAFISDRLGMTTQDSTIFSVDIYNTLLKLKDEILFGELQLNVKKESRPRLNMAFCDNIIPYVNKREFIEYLDSLSNYKINHVNTVSENTDILIRNADGTSSKSRAARIINDKYIADAMNSGEISLGDIGKSLTGSLKPIGSVIYVCSTDELVNKLIELGDA